MSDSLYQHLLLAVDFAPESEPVVARAERMRDRFAARLTLLHIVESVPTAIEYMPMSYSSDGILPDGLELEGELLRAARTQIDAVGERLGVPPGDRLIKIGTTGYTIDETAAELGVDLIIVGNKGRHGLHALLAPSTSKAVLRAQNCDVLCVHLGAGGY
ncbi:universal stress protein UspA-like protein [Thioflavicoccus mobilis 8321]|uniref:Universal stress protein n=1 Tax=Thioflavicoccus mobilis 8321 TaxID=765912 RepID=L0GXL2_9GAMM|nr:universal stress protein [Thioflavicoccus mobilis]AGA90731.1 universal stress protein UspA-like protein [Thioflavicoccus mobilis 8321]